MKHSEAAQIVAVMFKSYPHGKYDADNAKAYIDALQDLDSAACGAAVQRLIRTRKFLPSIAEIREAATEQSQGRSKTGAQAYEELMAAVVRNGAVPERRWNARTGSWWVQSPWPPISPDIAEAMRQTWGTWTDCCTAPDSQEVADRARFIAAYDGLAQRERQDLVAGKPLPAPTADGSPLRLADTRTRRDPRVAPQGPHDAKDAPAWQPVPAIAVQSRCNSVAPVVKTYTTATHAAVAPTPFQRRVTADELDAELARKGGAK